MRYRYKHFFAWLMVLIMMIGAMQSAAALEHNHYVEGNTAMLASLSAADCPMDHNEACCDLGECVMQCNFTPLQARYSISLAAAIVSVQKSTYDNTAITSYYPDLIKRPPKA